MGGRGEALGRQAGLELDVELFELVGLGLRAPRSIPSSRGSAMIGLAIGGAVGVELDVVGEEARAHRRDTSRRPCRALRRTGTARRSREALAPDRDDAVDVGLRAGPDLEAGIVRLEVHRQRRAQIGEAGMHLAARSSGNARARRGPSGSRPASGLSSSRYSAIASVSQTLTPSWVRQGTRNDGDSSSSSARVEGSSLDDHAPRRTRGRPSCTAASRAATRSRSSCW